MYICIKRTGGYGLHAVACAVVATFGRRAQTIVWKSSPPAFFCIVSVFDDSAFTCSSVLR